MMVVTLIVLIVFFGGIFAIPYIGDHRVNRYDNDYWREHEDEEDWR